MREYLRVNGRTVIRRGDMLGLGLNLNFIKARRLVKGQPEYLIKWKGFDDDKYDTWEGLANLSGLEPDLATFEAQQKRDQEDYVKQMLAAHTRLQRRRHLAKEACELRALRRRSQRLPRAKMRTERRPKRDMYVRYLPRLEKAVNCG